MTTKFRIQDINCTVSERRGSWVTHRLALAISICFATQSPLVKSEQNLIFEAARRAEAQLNNRVGLALYDTESGASWLYNADERFPMASTFKVLACGALLAHNDGGIHRRVLIKQSDLVAYSPVTEGLTAQEVSLKKLCAATLRTSDNTAVNKVLEALGGPAALTLSCVHLMTR